MNNLLFLQNLILKDFNYLEDNNIHLLDVIVEQGSDEEFPNKRDFAMSIYQGKNKPIILKYNPLLLEEDTGTIIGILRHEIAHIWFFTQGDVVNHTERETDLKAEELFGTPIFYNHNYVQTVYPTKYTIRPHHLPK